MATPASSPSPIGGSSATCPRCHRPIAVDADASGPCPACLLAAGFFTQPGPDVPADDAPPPTPAELAAEFPQLEIIELLGRGGMGAVYKARQRHLDRLVALKLLRPGLDADPSFAERFTREARALAQLNHPGIVTLHESGRSPGGLYFIVMEFVDGVNLRQLLAAGRLAPREALAIVPPLCDALQYAHDHGLVHRDIKPENILMDRLGRVKIADFGLAKLVAASGERTAEVSPASSSADGDLTEVGKVMGTPRYMAPEQRERPGEVDHRADIYALGVVLYQMLTGELPDEKQLQPPSRRVVIDVRLDEIVLRALEKDPALRYAAASEFKTRIQTLPPVPTARVQPAAQVVASAPIRLRVWLVPLLVLAACIAFTCSNLIPQKFTASATVQDGLSTPLNPEEIILSEAFLGQLATTDIPVARLRRDLSVTRMRISLITSITVAAHDPQQAADLANRAAKLFCEQHSARFVDRAVPPQFEQASNRSEHVIFGLLGGLIVILIFDFWELRRMLREPSRPAGLGLVLTGVLALPLLAVNLLVLVAVHGLVSAWIADALRTTQGRESFWGQLGLNSGGDVPQLVFVGALIVCLGADVWLIRRLHRSLASRWGGQPECTNGSSRRILLACALLLLAHLGLLALSAGHLPPRLASHFNGDGQPNGWMTRSAYLITAALLPLGVSAFFAGIAWLSGRLPIDAVNLPHRDHWFASERRAETVDRLRRWMSLPAALLFLFFMQLHLLVVVANQVNPPRLPGALILACALCLVGATMIWLVGMVRDFAEPAVLPTRRKRYAIIVACAALAVQLVPTAPLIDEWHDMPAKRLRSHAIPEPTPDNLVTRPLNASLSAQIGQTGFIEIAGVASYPPEATGWWAADGAQLSVQPWASSYLANWMVSDHRGAPKEQARQFAFHADGLGAAPTILSAEFIHARGVSLPSPASVRVSTTMDIGKKTALSTNLPDTRWSWFVVPLAADIETVNVRLLVAHGPFERVNETRSTGPGLAFSAQVGERPILVGALSNREGWAAVETTAKLGADHEWVLRAEDRLGGLHAGRIVAGYSNGELFQQTLVFDGVRVDEVLRLEIWTRPANKVEFTDVSTRSGHVTRPRPTVWGRSISAADWEKKLAASPSLISGDVDFFIVRASHPEAPDMREALGQIDALKLKPYDGVGFMGASGVEIGMGSSQNPPGPPAGADANAANRPGVMVTLRPERKGDLIHYSGQLTLRYRASDTGGDLITRQRPVEGDAKPATPEWIDLGSTDDGRRLIARIVFTVAKP